jgi:hypothetical protein
MKFVVDGMLGKLAKWLRILGFDAAYDPAADDDRLLAAARMDGRALLTRDEALLARAGGIPKLAVASLSWPEQVRQVLDAFDLRDETAPFTRCPECNAGLKLLSRDDAVKLVPPFVLERSAAFALCPSCGRVFWPGTHFQDMEARLEELLGPRKA